MRIDSRLHIDESELSERFVRASGPGGQHVNKAATAVQLRFDAAHSPSLPDSVRQRLLTLSDPRITTTGEIVIFADRHRSQARNRQEARERLAAVLARATRPAKRRRPTRVPRSAKKRRLENKKRRSRRKQLRKPPPTD